MTDRNTWMPLDRTTRPPTDVATVNPSVGAFVAWCVMIGGIALHGCSPSPTTVANPGARGAGHIQPCIASGNWPIIISNGLDYGEFPMGDMDHVMNLHIHPHEAWDQTEIRNSKVLLSTEDGKTLQIRSGSKFDIQSSFAPMHGVRIRGAVFDKARSRIITIGRDEPSRTEVDEFGGEGSLRVWSFQGRSLQSPYVFNDEPLSIARDLYSDHIIVGVRNGGVHVFRSDRNGVEVMMHGELWSTAASSVAMSDSGSFFAAAGPAGVKIWANGTVMPKIEDYSGDSSDEGTGNVAIIHGRNSYPHGRAVAVLGSRALIYQFGDDIALQQQIDLELFGILKIGPASNENEIIIISRNPEGGQMSIVPFHIHTLDVETKKMTRISWNGAQKTDTQ